MHACIRTLYTCKTKHNIAQPGITKHNITLHYIYILEQYIYIDKNEWKNYVNVKYPGPRDGYHLHHL